MKYQNVIQYAASLGLDCDTNEEAKLAILRRAEAVGIIPLHARGEQLLPWRRGLPSSKDEMEARQEEWSSRWSEAVRTRKGLKDYFRRVRVLGMYEARGEMVSRNLGLHGFEVYDGWAKVTVSGLLKQRAVDIRKAYPYPTGSSTPVISVGLSARDGKATASYSRMAASFTITREALMHTPCGPVAQDSVILDALPVTENIWFMQWAKMTGRTKSFAVCRGAYHDGELVIGFDSPEAVSENTNEIVKLARIRKVSRALKG